MPGFGLGGFGSGYFGEWYWENDVLWNQIPEMRRLRDEKQGQSFMRNFVNTIIPSVKMLRESIRDFFNLRNPWTCRTRYNQRHEIEIVSIEQHESDDPGNRWLSLYIKGSPIEEASKTWIIETQDLAFKRWVVERVYKLDSDTTLATLNWRVVIHGTEDQPVVGTKYWFRPEEQIVHLGADFGEEVDQYLGEARERSQILHHDQRRMWKGTRQGYEYICKLYGFTVSLCHLWRVRCGFETSLPPDEVFEIPVGSGKFYTCVEPRMPLYDEIAADIIPTDIFCSDPAFSSAIPLGPYPISSGTAFTSPYAGWELTINAPSTALLAIAWPGHWHLDVASGGTTYSYYLEAIPEYLGANVWKVIVSGAGPAPSGQALFDYACPVWLDCCYCGTHKIGVELEYDPSVVMTDQERLYVFERVVDAMYDLKPIHVEFARFALLIHGRATLNLRALLRKGISRRMVAGLRYAFDIVEADVIPTDLYSFTATLTH